MEHTPPYSDGPARTPAKDESNTDLHGAEQHATPSCSDSPTHDIPAIILQPAEAALASCPMRDRRLQPRS